MKKKVKPLKKGEYWFKIMRCEQHGFLAILIGDDKGGRRLTPSKCCGRWATVAKWRMTRDSIRSELEEALK